MKIEEQRQGAVTIVRPRGPLVQDDAVEFRTYVEDVMGRSLGRFVVDAAGIPYADSQGLEALLELTERLQSSGQSLRVCGATETLREVLEITDLAPQFEYYLDTSTAVRSFL